MVRLTPFTMALGLMTWSLTATSAFASAIKPRAPAPNTDFTNNVVFVPPSNWPSWRTIYARTLQLPDDSLLISWETYDAEPEYFPIWRSTDGGASWSEYSRVHDTVNGWGLRYQPFLYTLPEDIGGYPAGTILIAGPSAPADLSQVYIDVYASMDGGKTWEFVSHIAKGGVETVQNGNAAIWEPFFLNYNGQLICYISDQRDPAHAQKLVYLSTTDLKTWSDPVDVVAYPNYGDRPGMATVAHIESTGKWIMTYEYCGANPNCAAYYRVADSPLDFNQANGAPVIANDGSNAQPVGSPYVIWTPKPGATDGSGVIIMDGNSREELFVNDDAAGTGGWRAINVGQQAAYSRSLRVIDVLGQKKLLIANGGNMGNPDNNWVEVGVVEIPA